ncbi:hypothetical protein CONPUDRAFT_157225 [Coniophora puteana RWD-64-598 SS2]|uniref:Uncharacterized protein n=1 Tax=Coniophora puteana (strain RWD-64-598) TaxID=741705 RepID=A0A5M3MHF9_CONPW|nr:uncharacterized protein CONPUDRAFT_157225 [Coniophora puteana RWD-64-598 SS2]EIW78061.1 hypothetical protein CONPUDRAFT_157225 [Coniophora puteana RWD-64-598 SS2]
MSPTKNLKKRSAKQAATFGKAKNKRWTGDRNGDENVVSQSKQPSPRHTRATEKTAREELAECRKVVSRADRTIRDIGNRLSSTQGDLHAALREQEATARALVEKDAENTLLRQGLEETKVELDEQGWDLGKSKVELAETKQRIATNKEKEMKTIRHLSTSRQALQRSKDSKQKLERALKQLEGCTIPGLQQGAAAALQQQQVVHAHKTGQLRMELGTCQQEKNRLKKQVTGLQNKARLFQMRALRATRAHAKGKNIGPTYQGVTMKRLLTRKGPGRAYSGDLRGVVRKLGGLGCARSAIGDIVHTVLGSAGVDTSSKISRRTVSRMVLEGGVASQIQVAQEMKQATAITISSDDTGHRAVNYSAKHATVTTRENDGSVSHHIRLLGVDSTLDHSSLRQANDWEHKIRTLAALYNEFITVEEADSESSTGKTFNVLEFTRKLKGMHGDHAADQKATFKFIQEWKKRNAYLGLGYELLDTGSYPSDNPAYANTWQQARETLAREVGGEQGWAKLAPEDQAMHNAKMVHDVAMEWGKTKGYSILESCKVG